MPARLTAYPPDGAALVRVIEEGTAYRLGRASACELRIEHPSVSRFHAELEWRGDGWLLSDTGSKNGLRVDGHMVRSAQLAASTWFSVGDVQCSFERIDDAAVLVERLEHYFATYKLVPGEPNKMQISGKYGFEHAKAVIEASSEDYQEKFGDATQDRRRS